MSDPLDIGGVRYGLVEAVQLRGEIIEMRNAAMKLEPPNMTAAVVLSHTIALLAALIQSKWPMEWAELAGKYTDSTGKRPAKYGDALLDLPGTVTNLEAMEDHLTHAWNLFKQEPALETWAAVNEYVLRARMLLDIAAELLTEEDGDGEIQRTD